MVKVTFAPYVPVPEPDVTITMDAATAKDLHSLIYSGVWPGFMNTPPAPQMTPDEIAAGRRLHTLHDALRKAGVGRGYQSRRSQATDFFSKVSYF